METENTIQPPTPAPVIEQTSLVSPASPKTSKRLMILVILFVVIAVVGIGAYVLGAKTQVSQPVQPAPLAVTQPTPTPDPTANWKTYNYNNVLTLKYPPSWVVGSGAEGCGPTIGLPTKRTDVTVYSYITLCSAPITEKNKSFSYTTQDVMGMNSDPSVVGGSPSSVLKEIIDNHGITKIKIATTNSGKSIYTIYVDKAYYLTVESYFNDQKYRADTNITQEEFITVVDQILSTFKFTN